MLALPSITGPTPAFDLQEQLNLLINALNPNLAVLNNPVDYGTNTATSAATLGVADVSGGFVENFLAMTGTLGAGAALTLPLAADLIAAIPQFRVGQSYGLRIINRSSANFAWTVTTNTGWALTGTMTIAQNTWRDFVVTFPTASTATLQAVGTGTDS